MVNSKTITSSTRQLNLDRETKSFIDINYEQVNRSSFQKNFRDLIGHYKSNENDGKSKELPSSENKT